jgi:predicted ATP-grasp superfamily ATP-dependent carboligase
VHVTASRQYALAARSRFARARHDVRPAAQDPDGFVEDVAAIARTTGVRYVLPMSDASCAALLPARNCFKATVLGPDANSFALASDKARILTLAGTFGILAPPQVQHSAAGLPLPAPPSFPVVIKPHHTVAGRASLSVGHAANESALADAVRQYAPDAYPLLLQRRVVGPGRGIFLLRTGGRIVARFAHQRLVEMPPSGGHAVYAESIPLEEELCSRVEALLEALDWEGPAMAEFKVERATGVPYLMEVNGRFWGSLQLAIDSGVDFPALWLDCIEGRTVMRPTYRVGMRMRSPVGLLSHLATRLRHPNGGLSLPADAPSLAAVTMSLISLRRHDRFDTLRLSDPGPFATEFAVWLGHAMRVITGTS